VRREDLREGLLVSHGLRVGLLVWKKWFIAVLVCFQEKCLGLCFSWEGRRGIVCTRVSVTNDLKYEYISCQKKKMNIYIYIYIYIHTHYFKCFFFFLNVEEPL
jgi:hypothetical protein